MGASPIYTKRMQKALQVRGRRRHHDLQGPAARHRRPTAVHGLPLHRARPLARRVPPRPLRCAAGRRADGRGLRPRHVPRHRGPDLRRHRRRHQPEGADAPDPPPAAGARRSAPALRVDRDHRRVPSPRSRTTRRWTSCAEHGPPATELDPIDPDDDGQSDYSGPLVSDVDFADVLALRPGAHRRRGLPADAPAEPVVRHRGTASEQAPTTEHATQDLHQAADRDRRARAPNAFTGRSGCRAESRVRCASLELHPLFNPVAYVDRPSSLRIPASASVRRTRRRRVDVAGSPAVTTRPLHADRRRHRSASRRGGHRNRHRLVGSRDRNRAGRKGTT